MLKFANLSVFLIALASTSGCASPLGLVLPTPYASTGIKAKIVDETTGQPLSGVVVMATWGNITPDYSIGYAETAQYTCEQLVNVITATSGEDGQFEIPAWSGKWGHCQYMLIYDPRLLLYKPGYEVLDMQNAGTYTDDYTPAAIPTIPRWNGQTIQMKPLGPHSSNKYSDNYFDNLYAYSRDLGILIQRNPEKCFWTEARPALLMLLQEERRLRPYSRQEPDMFEHYFTQPYDPHGGLDDWMCGDQKDYYSSLIAEAAKTQPDMPMSGPQASADTRAIDFDVVSQIRASVEHAPDETADQDAELVYHVKLDKENPNELIITAVFPLNAKPEAAAGLYEDYPSRNPWKADRGFNCYNFMGTSDAAKMQTGVSRTECSWFDKLQTSTLCTRDCSTDYYFADTDTRVVSTFTFIRPTSTTLPEYVQLDHVDDLVVATSLEPAGPSRWRLPPARQLLYLVVHPPGMQTRSTDLCEKAVPDSLKDYLAIREPLRRLVRTTDLQSDDAKHSLLTGKCPMVLRGHFTGGEETDYVVGLTMNYPGAEPERTKPIMWFIAEPRSTDWVLIQTNSGCDVPMCHISLAKPGVYHFKGRKAIRSLHTQGIPPRRYSFTKFQYDVVMKHDGYILTDEFEAGQNYMDYTYYDNGNWKTGRAPTSH